MSKSYDMTPAREDKSSSVTDLDLDLDTKVYEHDKMATPIAASVEIVAGLFLFFFYIGMMVVRAWSFQAGFGFWAGFGFILAGCVSIAAHRIKKLLYIMCSFFAHIITFLFALALFTVSCIGLDKHRIWYHLLQGKSYEMVLCESVWNITDTSVKSQCDKHLADRNTERDFIRDGVILHALILVLSILLLPSTVIQLGLCVRGINKARSNAPIAPEDRVKGTVKGADNKRYPANIVSMV